MNPARKLYLDNIRWMTVVLVVIYHVVYMFNGVQPFGVIGPFREHQLQDCFQYLVYPWFMACAYEKQDYWYLPELRCKCCGA